MNTDKKVNYATVSLQEKTLADLKRLRLAAGYSTGNLPTYSELIGELIAGLEKSNPALYNCFRGIDDRNFRLL